MTTRGKILSGKKFHMMFTYTPELSGKHEGFWIFEIPSHKIKEWFYLVGTVKEPNVFFDVGKINFGPLLLGGKSREIVHINNLEDIPFYYKFQKESLTGSPEYANSL